jgi:predicted CopG family antitoxin
MGRGGSGRAVVFRGLYFVMGSKNIAIETDAYDRLAAHKRSGESFTDVIRRILPPTPSLTDVLRSLENNPLSEHSADAILDQVAARRTRVEDSASRKHAS